MISKLFKSLLSTSFRFSTLSSTPLSLSTISPSILKDYQYARLIEESNSIDSYKLLIESYENKVVLDNQTVKLVYNRVKGMEGGYEERVYQVWKGSLGGKKTEKEFRELCEIGNRKQDIKNEITSSISENSTSSSSIPSPTTNPVLKDLLTLIKSAGQSNSNLILNNVQIQFDYKYLYGNPLANEGLQEYNEGSGLDTMPQVDTNDILSCMKKIKIGEVQFVKVEIEKENK